MSQAGTRDVHADLVPQLLAADGRGGHRQHIAVTGIAALGEHSDDAGGPNLGVARDRQAEVGLDLIAVDRVVAVELQLLGEADVVGPLLEDVAIDRRLVRDGRGVQGAFGCHEASIGGPPRWRSGCDSHGLRCLAGVSRCESRTAQRRRTEPRNTHSQGSSAGTQAAWRQSSCMRAS